jgi:hypothetical protein
VRLIAARSVTALVALGLFGVAAPATAGDKPFATGLMLYSGFVIVDTGCRITNVGKRPVTITSTAIQNFDGTTFAPSCDSCVGPPLAAGGVCQFGGSAGVYGGGIAMVKGNTKNLRGHCVLYDQSPSHLGVQIVVMQ